MTASRSGARFWVNAFVAATAIAAFSATRLDASSAIPEFGHEAVQLGSGNPPRSQTCVLFPSDGRIMRRVTEGDALYFSYAVDTRKNRPPAEGVRRFEVAAVAGRKASFLFQGALDPRNPADHGWHDVKLELDRYVGETVEIRFSVKRSSASGELLPDDGGSLWGGVRVGNFRRRDSELNVILISLDTLRADRLGCYGYKRRKTSPNIDALAEKSILFVEAISQSPWTRPSHASIFTGLYPSYHGAFSAEPHEGPSLAGKTIAEDLRDHGYVTQAITGSGNIGAVFGFFHGFDRYFESAISEMDGSDLFKRAEDWIRENKREKFFLFLHTYDIHGPFRHTRFGDEWQQRYDSGIRYADDRIGQFMAFLRGAGLEESSVVVLLSDHGEDLGTHVRRATHGHTLYDEVIRVPLMFYVPSRYAPRRIKNFQAQLIDVYPTVMEVLGLAAPRNVQGRSLVPLLKGGRPPKESTAISEAVLRGHERKSIRYRNGGRAYKFIVAPHLAYERDPIVGKVPFVGYFENWMAKKMAERVVAWKGREFYDLTADRSERKNIAQNDRPVLNRLEAAIRDYLLNIPESGAPAPSAPPMPMDELREQLRSLGY